MPESMASICVDKKDMSDSFYVLQKSFDSLEVCKILSLLTFLEKKKKLFLSRKIVNLKEMKA